MNNPVAALDAEVLPVSFAQQRLWFLDQFDPNKPLYNIPLEVYLGGPLDVAALERCFNEIVRRHEVLRTTFRTVNGEPVQVIAPTLAVELPVTDLTGLPESERTIEARRLADEEARRPFDLRRGPLLRVSLLRLRAEEHLLLVTMHHIITDGWAVNILKGELGALYEAYSEGRESPLPELPIQYADFAQWQREWLQGGVLEEQLTFWREQLEGAPPLLLLPTDYPRPAARSYRGASIDLFFDASLAGALHALSRREGCTLFMTLLAAWQVLLARHAGQTDIVVGTPIANRHREEVEDLIGFFVNTLALRADMTSNPTFRELLRQVRGRALAAYEHQDVPFERLVEELRPERSLSHSTIFQVLFALQNTPAEEERFAGLTVSYVDGETGTSKYDLVLSLEEKDGGLDGDIKYSTDLFTAETIGRLGARFEVLLRAVAADPDRRVSELPLLTESERRQILAEFNDTAAAYEPECLHRLFERQAGRTPGATAVAYEDEELTFAELDARANRLAHHLRTLGVGADVLVGLYMERSIEVVVSLLAVLKAGGAYLPLDPEYPRERLAFMLEDAGARVLLTQSSLRESVPETAAEVVCLDEQRGRIEAYPADEPRAEVTPANLAYVIYTSGSTGMPKGVMISHGSVVNLLTGLDRAVYAETAGPQLRVGVNGSLAFDTSVKQLIQLLKGHAVRLLPEEARRDGEALLKYLGDRPLDVLDCTPSMLGLLLECGLLDAPGALPRLVLVGGEAIDPAMWETLARVKGADFYNVYGPTECTVDATACRIRRDAARPNIGRPIANCRVYILDRHMEPVPLGVAGELHVGGAGLARGYLGRPSLTAERFIPNPFSTQRGARLYRTGDLARHLPDGSVEYLGRVDGQVKVRGHRIELGEVEAALGHHEGVRECAVTAREDGPGGRRLVAYVVARDGEGQTTAEQLRGYLKERLPEYMIPSAFVLLDSLPLTPNGKVDRAALPAPDAALLAPIAEYVAPRTPDEEAVAAIWQEVLEVERVGIRDNFFDLGGHSLLATQVLSKVRKRLGAEVALRSMFAAPTVEALAAEVGRAGVAQPPSIQRLARDRYVMTPQTGGQFTQD